MASFEWTKLCLMYFVCKCMTNRFRMLIILSADVTSIASHARATFGETTKLALHFVFFSKTLYYAIFLHCAPAPADKSLDLEAWGGATRTRSEPKSPVQVSLFYCLTAFRPERTTAFRVLLTAAECTDHNGYNARSNPKLAEAIRNLGAVLGVFGCCAWRARVH